MNKKIIIWLAVGIAAIIGVITVSYPEQNSEGKEQVAALGVITNLITPETDYDFGTISMAAGKVSHSFEIINDSSSTLALDKLYTSCMCTKAYFVNGDKNIGPFGMPGHGFVPGLGEELKPGEKAEIEVVFDPAAHGPAGIGPIERAIILESNGNAKKFGIKTVVIP